MGDNIRVHGTIRRSKRLELAVAKIITEVRKWKINAERN